MGRSRPLAKKLEGGYNFLTELYQKLILGRTVALSQVVSYSPHIGSFDECQGFVGTKESLNF